MSEVSGYYTCVRMSPAERDRIAAYAERHGRMSVSAVIRQAVNEYLDRRERVEKSESGSRIVDTGAAAL